MRYSLKIIFSTLFFVFVTLKLFSQDVSCIDEFPPFAFVKNYVVLDLSEQDLPALIYARDFDNGSWDDCSSNGQLIFSFSQVKEDSVLDLTLLEKGVHPITIFVFDNSGKMDTSTSELVLIDCENDQSPPILLLKDIERSVEYDPFALIVHAKDFNDGSYHYCLGENLLFSFSEDANDTLREYSNELLFNQGYIMDELEVFVKVQGGEYISQNVLMTLYDCNGCFPVYPTWGGLYLQPRVPLDHKDSIKVNDLGLARPGVCNSFPRADFSQYFQPTGLTGSPNEYIYVNHLDRFDDPITLYSYQYGDYTGPPIESRIEIQEQKALKIEVENPFLTEGSRHSIEFNVKDAMSASEFYTYFTIQNGIGIVEIRVADDYKPYFDIQSNYWRTDIRLSNDIPEGLELEGNILRILVDIYWDGNLYDFIRFPDHSFVPGRWASKVSKNYWVDSIGDFRIVEFSDEVVTSEITSNVSFDMLNTEGDFFTIPENSEIEPKNFQFTFTDALGNEMDLLEPCLPEEGTPWHSFNFCLDTIGHPLPYLINFFVQNKNDFPYFSTLDVISLHNYLIDKSPIDTSRLEKMDLNCNGVWSITDFLLGRLYLLQVIPNWTCYGWVDQDLEEAEDHPYFPREIFTLPSHHTFLLKNKNEGFGEGEDVKLLIENAPIASGEIMELDIHLQEEKELLGLQLGLNYDWNYFEVLDISYEGNPDLSSFWPIIDQGEFRILFLSNPENPLFEKGLLLKMTIKAKKDFTLSEALFLDAMPLKGEVILPGYIPGSLFFEFDETIGIDELNQASSIDVSPNPFTHSADLRIKSTDPILSCQLVDLFGNVRDISVQNSLDKREYFAQLEHFYFTSPGVYFIRVFMEGEMKTLKVVKME